MIERQVLANEAAHERFEAEDKRLLGKDDLRYTVRKAIWVNAASSEFHAIQRRDGERYSLSFIARTIFVEDIR